MHATFRDDSGVPGLVDGRVRHADKVRAVLGEIDGFRAYDLVRTGADEAVSFTAYDSADGADRSSRVVRDSVARELFDLTVGAPNIASGEVAINR